MSNTSLLSKPRESSRNDESKENRCAIVTISNTAKERDVHFTPSGKFFREAETDTIWRKFVRQ
jgi:hypothetical protein